MKGTIHQHNAITPASQENIDKVLAGGGFFWVDLDLQDPGPDDDVEGLLVNTFHFHPLAVTASMRFGQRPRIDDYDDFVQLITFGMAANGKDLTEVHLFITEKCGISLHHGDCPALANVHEQMVHHHSSQICPPQVAVVYLMMDSLIDSFFPVLS